MTIQEANKLIKKYLKLRDEINITGSSSKSIEKFQQYQNHCIQKFKYLVLMKTNRYKSFNNYEDLVQEGLEALVKALNTYNPAKGGNIFWWMHKYIDTRISRCANLHTTIRFPLKYAKHTAPYRESILPVLVDQLGSPYDILEQTEMIKEVKQNFTNLSVDQQKVVGMLFGMDGELPQSVSKVCQKLQISRPACAKVLGQVMSILKRNIEV